MGLAGCRYGAECMIVRRHAARVNATTPVLLAFGAWTRGTVHGLRKHGGGAGSDAPVLPRAAVARA